MADLDDKLARRLGDLNIKRLFSGEPVPWVVEAKVKAGQTVHRAHTQKSLSRVRLFATPWVVAHQAPQSMGFSRHEYWSGLPFASPV